jgi:hypothetical protein
VRHVPQHAVERRTHLADLGARVGVRLGHAYRQRHLAPVQRQLGDPPRGGRHPAQRPQRAADDEHPDAHGHEHARTDHRHLDADEPQDGVVDARQRQGVDDGGAVRPLDRRDPVVAEAGQPHGAHVAVGRHRDQRVRLRGGQVAAAVDLGVHPLGVDHRPCRDLRADGVGWRAGREEVAGARAARVGVAVHRLAELLVDLVDEVVADGERGRHPDQQPHHRHQRDDRREQARPQRPAAAPAERPPTRPA